jgi:glycosyltransferase involved in cell wall biosynthesis
MFVPSITIISLTYNADEIIWKKTLEAIKRQNYEKKLIEHLVIDGGSTNKTIKIAKEYSCNILSMPELKVNPEGRKGNGIRAAKGNIIAFIESDNILPNKNWFLQMIEPFQKDKNIVGAFSMHNSFEDSMPILTKYSALLGVNDPTVYYLGKSEKLLRSQIEYNKGDVLDDNKRFTIVRFNEKNLPVMGDNGHMVKRTIIQKVNKNPNKFLHTDAYMQLMDRGYDTYGVVKNSIIHYTGSSIVDFYKKRITFKNTYTNNRSIKRSYLVYNPNSQEDKKRLILFVIYSLTGVQPLYVSIRGFIQLHELAWFLHPLMCFLATSAYGISEILSILKSNKHKAVF